MAREESDREDLLRDATALVERIELAATSCAIGAPSASTASIVVGFRRNGAISIYFGADPVYQFNAEGALRRAYVDGLMFKASGGRLVSLERARSANRVELRRHALTQERQTQFVDCLDTRLRGLSALLAEDGFTIVGQAPAERGILERVKTWLANHKVITVAAAPNA